MSIFSKFNELVNLDEVARDLAELNANGRQPEKKEYKEVTPGEYNVIIKNALLKETRNGDNVQLAIQFKIQDGEFEKSVLFYNQTLITAKNFGLRKAKEFLTSLESGIDIEFKDFDQFAELVLDVFNAVQNDTYKLEFNINEKGYREYKILEKLDSLPF